MRGLWTEEISIPGSKVCRLIGKDGTKIKSFQETYNVKMIVIQDGCEETLSSKPLVISGDRENVELAVQGVKEFLNQFENEVHPGVLIRASLGLFWVIIKWVWTTCSNALQFVLSRSRRD